MRKRLLAVACLIASYAGLSADFKLEGEPFAIPNLEVVWKAPSNALPEKLWVYKCVSQEFSSNVISHLMALGDFNEADRTHIQGQAPFKDRRIRYYANQERTRHLGIFPELGWIDYADETANYYGKERAKGVPSESETLELALKLLQNLEIEQGQLAGKEGTSQPYVYRSVRDRSFKDPDSGEKVKEVIRRGVSFVRRLDGINFTGMGADGGVGVAFGPRGRLASLEVVWRNLQRHKSYEVMQAADMVKAVKNGEAKRVPMDGGNPQTAGRLTVVKVTPFYLGDEGSSRQEFAYPFAALECTVDGGSNRIVLKCPIIRH